MTGGVSVQEVLMCLRAATGVGYADERSRKNQLIITVERKDSFQFSSKKALCRFTRFTEFLLRGPCFVAAAKRLA